jgi:hypothetical protein
MPKIVVPPSATDAVKAAGARKETARPVVA